MSRPSQTVLVAEDDDTVRRMLTRSLRSLNVAVTDVADGAEAIAALARAPFDLVISDWAMPNADGYAVLEASRRLQPGTPVVILTGQAGVRECVEAMRAGASDFLSKPLQAETLGAVVRAALGRRLAPASQVAADRTGAPVVGRSRAIARVFETVARVAPTDTTVLITGETGSGKEVIARLVHGASLRSGGRFVPVNCGALPEALIESQLFGHVRGAFTGATESRAGLAREADGGTLFLDEIGELPLGVQARLLRLLQERQVLPVGCERAHTVDVRFVSATNRDLEAMVRQGTFRQDLYFRLAVFPIQVPPLRERPEDVPDLIDHFLTRHAERSGRRPQVSPGAMALLAVHGWPGNIRELENTLQRAVILDRDGVIDGDDLGLTATSAAAPQAAAAASALSTESIDLPAALARIERTLIDHALERTGGNRAQAAVLLGISRTTLVDKLKRRS